MIVVAPVTGGFLEQMSVLSPASDTADGCELPVITQQLLPRMTYMTEAGLAIGLVIAVACAVSFRLAGSEVVRYRVLSVSVSVGWSAIALGILGVCLALWVLPGVKCGS